MHISAHDLTHLLSVYGYWAVLIAVGLESTGIPFPGETTLLVAAVYAGTTHRLNIVGVIAAAAAGAILGDNLGFWVGREGGFRLLRRYGPYIRLDERKLKLGQYLFHQHGAKVVFFGRFVAVLRAWAAFLAGTNRMPWSRFLPFNAAGGIVWSTLYGAGGYALGKNVNRLAGPVGIALAVIAAIIITILLVFLKRNEQRLEEEAMRALPGPLEVHQLRQAGRGHRRPGSADHQMPEPTHPKTNAAGRPDVRHLDATRAKNKR
jgi:membrane protein DedA with SNARE-associated domain